LFAQYRTEEPEVEIRLTETSLSQQIKGLNSDLFNAGFVQSDEVPAQCDARQRALRDAR
jgi:hypothetical protein